MVLLIVILGSFLGVAAWRWVDQGATNDQAPRPADGGEATAGPPPDATDVVSPPETTPPTPPPERVAYVITRDGTGLRSAGEETSTPVAGGVLLPVLGETDGSYRIFDTCNQEGWVAPEEVDQGLVPEGPVDGFDRAVFVIDPGHGLPDYGAIGPAGLTESEANLDVATRVVELLRSSRDVNWETGAVTAGSEVPAAATAVLTRGPNGPNGGDYQLGLSFRSMVANSLEATALVSIHHNSSPEMNLDHPGSEAFVSATDPDSPRLGGLMVEELRTSFSRFEADWMGSSGSGLISRVNAEGGDYYSILSRSEVPAVIVEGVYISNPSEEALAMTDEFRQTYAEAVYRALVRFVTTDDYPIPAPDPELWEVNRPGPSMSDCQVPAP